MATEAVNGASLAEGGDTQAAAVAPDQATATVLESVTEPASVAEQPETQPAQKPAESGQQPKTYTEDEVNQLLEEAKKAAVSQEDPKEKEYKDRMAALEARELESSAKDLMRQKEVPETFLGFLLQKDMETTTKNVEDFKAAFDAEVKAKLDAALVGKTPPVGNTGTVTSGDKSAADVFAAALRR